MMKKILCLLLAVFFVFSLSACATDAFAPGSEPTVDEIQEPTDLIANRASVVTVRQEEYLYPCEQCKGNCSYFVGQFRCAAIDSKSDDAQAINAEIAAHYEKYLHLAKTVGTSGLAYGFDFATDYKNEKYVILRTAIETVLLHNGGTYSYDFYYYDLENDCKTDVAAVCSYFGLDINVIAAYLRIELSENAGYEVDQIGSIAADCLDLFPSADDDSYYVRVQNDRLKYETKIRSADLNARGEEIASLIKQDENADEVTDEEDEAPVFVHPTTEQDVIYMDYE